MRIKFLLVFLFIFPVLAGPVLANELLPSGQIIEADYIRAGNSIQIDGEIKGDAFLMGGLVTVNGKVGGDLFVLGGKVNINGEVGNSIRVLAGDVTVSSGINRNLLVICGNCVVTKQTTVGGSLIIAGGNGEISAPKIGRGFRFFGNRLFLNSEVANEAYVVADREFLLGPAASISGNLKYSGNNEAILEPGATVGGNISYQKNVQDDSYPRFFGARTVLSQYRKIKPLTEFLGFFVTALVGFILLGLFSKGFEKVVRAIEIKPYASFGYGFVVVIGLPVVAVLFALTIVGLPVAFVLVLLGWVIYLAAQYLAAFFVGRKILMSKFGERRGWALVLGLFLFYILGLIPIIGGIVRIVLVLFALGAIILAYKQPVIIEQRPLPFEFPSVKQGRSKKS